MDFENTEIAAERVSNEIMATKVPVGQVYSTRNEAVCALTIAVLEAGGHAVQQDKLSGNKTRVMFRCPTLFAHPQGKEKGRTRCVLHNDADLDGFTASQKPGESKHTFARRRLPLAEKYSIQKGCCPFKAILVRNQSEWSFQTLNNGKNYEPHMPSCSNQGIAKGDNLRKLMRKAIHVDPSMPIKKVMSAMVGDGSRISRANLPTRSSINRQQMKIKYEDLDYYELNYSRLADFLIELKKKNPDWQVTLQQDDETQFERLFIGFTMNMNVLKKAGLDVYSIDACHINHIIAHGMQLHLLLGKTGANRNVILAMSIDVGETTESYTFFAHKCKMMGLDSLFCLNRNFIPNKPVLFSDGMKGLPAVVALLENVHHALCAKHLGDSCRAWLKAQREAISEANRSRAPHERLELPVVTLPNYLVYALCRACTTSEYRVAFHAMKCYNKFAAEYFKNKSIGQFSQNAMLNMDPPVACHGSITSNGVEGTNGVLLQMRGQDPYTIIHQLVMYVAAKLNEQRHEIAEMVQKGKTLSTYAGRKFVAERQLSIANEAYSVTVVGDLTFAVVDALTVNRAVHQVCLRPDNISCVPCNFFGQHHEPCRHMQLAIAQYAPHLLTTQRKEYLKTFFHPSYLVENLEDAYKDQVVHLPDAPVGPPLPTCDDEDEEEEPLLLPPLGFRREDYKAKPKRGRPPTKRKRSRGAVGDDGARVRKRSKGIRQGRSSAAAGRNALKNFTFNNVVTRDI
jgi:hypothetical protein